VTSLVSTAQNDGHALARHPGRHMAQCGATQGAAPVRPSLMVPATIGGYRAPLAATRGGAAARQTEPRPAPTGRAAARQAGPAPAAHRPRPERPPARRELGPARSAPGPTARTPGTRRSSAAAVAWR